MGMSMNGTASGGRFCVSALLSMRLAAFH